jgi:hypothetical protein
MARAHTVWVLVAAGVPRGAFTVKKELVRYLKQYPNLKDSPLYVFRCPDGRPEYSERKLAWTFLLDNDS